MSNQAKRSLKERIVQEMKKVLRVLSLQRSGIFSNSSRSVGADVVEGGRIKGAIAPFCVPIEGARSQL